MLNIEHLGDHHRLAQCPAMVSCSSATRWGCRYCFHAYFAIARAIPVSLQGKVAPPLTAKGTAQMPGAVDGHLT